MEFVAVSYNVRHRVLDDDRDAWERRCDGVFDVLRSHTPEIVGLQESTGSQQRAIEAALGSYRWYGVAEEPGSGEHNPVGVGGRFVSQDQHTEWLSETPAEQSAAYPRVLTRVLLEDTRTERSLAVYNAHFDHKGKTAREQSARRIRDRVGSLPADTEALVLGDFNCRPDTRPYDILSADGNGRTLRDARDVATTVEGPVSTVSDFETLDPGRRLDYAFVTAGLVVDSYRADDRVVDGRYPSDHLPVAVTLRFE
jgi:endonuclease/exonuclease/phosphatase family metal-dependent hydrolase